MKNMILILSLIQVCCTTNQFIGTYASKKSFHRFTFRADSTFYYQYKGHIWINYSTGDWEVLDKRHVRLQSGFTNTLLNLKVNEDTSGRNMHGMLVSIDMDIPSDEKQYYKYVLGINDSIFVGGRCDSATFTLKNSVSVDNFVCKITADDTVMARFLDTLSTQKYYIKNKNTKKLNIQLYRVDSLFNYQVFNNQLIKIRRKGIMYNSEYIKRSKFRY